MIKLEDFGKDHWSVLAYAETCAVDSYGRMDVRRLRVNSPKRGIASQPYGPNDWKPSYGTRLKDGSIPDPEHDDFDCLDEFEELGLIETGTLVNPFVSFTDLGLKVASELRQHKAKGGQFRDFESETLKQEVVANGS